MLGFLTCVIQCTEPRLISGCRFPWFLCLRFVTFSKLRISLQRRAGPATFVITRPLWSMHTGSFMRSPQASVSVYVCFSSFCGRLPHSISMMVLLLYKPNFLIQPAPGHTKANAPHCISMTTRPFNFPSFIS